MLDEADAPIGKKPELAEMLPALHSFTCLLPAFSISFIKASTPCMSPLGACTLCGVLGVLVWLLCDVVHRQRAAPTACPLMELARVHVRAAGFWAQMQVPHHCTHGALRSVKQLDEAI